MVGRPFIPIECLNYFGDTVGLFLEIISSGEADTVNKGIVFKIYTEILRFFFILCHIC